MRTKLILLLVALLIALPVSAQDNPTPAPRQRPERPMVTVTPESTDIAPDANAADGGSGVQIITGQFDYSDPKLATYGSQPEIVLLDLSGAATQAWDPATGYYDLSAPQYLGQFTSDVSSAPLSYALHLPSQPGGNVHNVDHIGADDQGVMLYDVNFAFNIVGSPYLERQDVAWASSDVGSENYHDLHQIQRGKLLVYATDAHQGFPAYFGRDGILFTDDDPLVDIQQGWTVVDLDTRPFTFDRSETATVDLIESDLDSTPDFSDQSYGDAFASLIETMRHQYAFSDFYHLDWDAIEAKYAPRFAEADRNHDVATYELALRDFFQTEIPDGHVAIDRAPYLESLPNPPTEQAGGIGLTIRTLDDGRAVASYVSGGDPASQAGIETRAEIISINGVPVQDAIDAAKPPYPPYSNQDLKRLDQERMATRFPVGAEVEITYKNPDDDEAKTVTLTATDESSSFNASLKAVYGAQPETNLPVEFKILDDNYGYVKINSFYDDGPLTVTLWQRALQYFEDNQIPGIVIDLRQNGGGWPFNGDTMLGYLFDQPQTVGEISTYFPDENKVLIDPTSLTTIVPANGPRYHGKIAVMVSPVCFSQCEFFSYALQYTGRATIIGQYATGGLGGGVINAYLPEGVQVQYTIQGAHAPDGSVKIQATGVVPDVKVPVNEETLFDDDDAILDAAVDYLDDATTLVAHDAGSIRVGQSKNGTIEPFTTVQYTLTVSQDRTVNIRLSDREQALDTLLWVFDGDGNLIDLNDDYNGTVNSGIDGLELKAGDTITLQAELYDVTQSGQFTLSVQPG